MLLSTTTSRFYAYHVTSNVPIEKYYFVLYDGELTYFKIEINEPGYLYKWQRE